jgi:hypothetical protein
MKRASIIFSVFCFIFIIALNKTGDKAFSDIIAFMSIAIGFSITSLSITASSNFSKMLYLKEYAKDNSKTLLHILVDNFKASSFLFLSTICLILLYKLIDISSFTVVIKNTKFNIIVVFASIIWCLTIFSIIEFINLLSTFSKFVIKTAKDYGENI